MIRSRGSGQGCIGHPERGNSALRIGNGFGMASVPKLYGSGSPLPNKAKRVRQLADAAWQPDLQDTLRSLAKIMTRSRRILRAVLPRSATQSFWTSDHP
jgi:hypothetical protein